MSVFISSNVHMTWLKDMQSPPYQILLIRQKYWVGRYPLITSEVIRRNHIWLYAVCWLQEAQSQHLLPQSSWEAGFFSWKRLHLSPLSFFESPPPPLFQGVQMARDLVSHYKRTTNQAESQCCTVLEILNSQNEEETHRCQAAWIGNHWEISQGQTLWLKGTCWLAGKWQQWYLVFCIYAREEFSDVNWIEKSLKSYNHEILETINPFYVLSPANLLGYILCQ